MKKLNIIFTEFNPEYGAMQIVGETKLEETTEEQLLIKAKEFSSVLQQVRGKEIHYYLQNEYKHIIVDNPLQTV